VQKTIRAPRSPWNRLSPKFNRLLDDDSVSGVNDDDPMDVDNNSRVHTDRRQACSDATNCLSRPARRIRRLEPPRIA
jgi:hypothetical protein